MSSVLPVPVNRGCALRTDQILRGLLAQGFSVRLLLLNQSEAFTTSKDITQRTLEYYDHPNLDVEVRRHPRMDLEKERRSRKFGQLVRRLSASSSAVIRDWTGQAARINAREHLPSRFERLIRTRAKEDVDLIWFNYARVCPPNLKASGKVVVDLHDIQTRRIQNDILPTMPAWRRHSFLRKFRASEIEVLEAADLCVAISDVETEILREQFTQSARVETINATFERREMRQTPSEPFDLLFVGSNSTPNVVGLGWFLEKVWPRLVEERPCTLRVIGRVTRNKKLLQVLEQVDHREQIECVEFVEDLSNVYSNAKVVICPVLHGTGMKIKVVEAMAWGAALVATSAALEGIPLNLGLTGRDTVDDFKMHIVGLLSDEGARNAAQRASVETHERHHSKRYLDRRLRDLLGQLELTIGGDAGERVRTP